jgi:hypothetical protein
MNTKRGFNRIFAILAAAWVLYCLLVYPLRTQKRLVDDAIKHGSECYDGAADSNARKTCLELWSKVADDAAHEWTLRNYYKTAWPYILGAIALIPAAVYSLCRLVGFVFGWVYKGFGSA